VLSFLSPSGFIIEATTSAQEGFLKEFYSGFDQAFVLENEKETLEGFVRCLALNEGQSYSELSGKYGPFAEFILVARDPATSHRIGGANFITFLLSEPGKDTPVLTTHLNYIFINKSFQRQGLFARLVSDLPGIIFRLFAATITSKANESSKHLKGVTADIVRMLIFIEQNDPFRMPPEDYLEDTKLTGLDQIDRIEIWRKLGAKLIDFEYVQPQLSSDQEADRNLVLAVLGADGPNLSTCLLQAHLHRFFSISVLKGRDALDDGSSAAQLALLEEKCRAGQPIALLDVTPEVLRKAQAADKASRPSSLTQAVKTFS
jgi:hypothetical protein